MKSLPIRERLAQLFMVGFSGSRADEELGSIISEHKFTSFILFAHNAGDAAGGRDAGNSKGATGVRDSASVSAGGLSAMIADARALAEPLELPPLLFAADEEGGLISPLGRVVGRLPSAMALAAGGSTLRARRAAALVGSRLKSVGLDLVLAPVLDVNDRPENPVIGTRSFGDDPRAVAEMGAAVIEGFQAAGLACCAKHFPGHGSTGEDSHETLPVVRYDASLLEAKDLVPFKRAFELGVEAAMTAHVAYPGVVGLPLRPATVSRRIQTDLLRKKMDFKGTLLSDSMEMKGITGFGEPERACVDALKAGVDLFICVDQGLAQRCLREIRRALEEGDVTPATLERALANVAYLKTKTSAGTGPNGLALSPDAGTAEAAPPDEMGSGGRSDENGDFILGDCYAASITPVGCKAEDLRELLAPVRRGLLIVPDGLPGYGNTDVSAIRRQLTVEGIEGRWEVHTVPFDPDAKGVAGALSRIDAADDVVICTLSRGTEPSGQVKLARAALRSGKLLMAVALLDPYGLTRLFPAGTPGVATYGFWPECTRALADTLFGQGAAPGVLPIDIGKGNW